MRRVIVNLLKNEDAVATIEFVLVAPILLLLLFGGIEVTRYMLINQKVEKATYSLTNMVAQLTPITTPANTGQIDDTALNGIFNQFYGLMQPFARGGVGTVTNGIVVFNSVIRVTSGDKELIRWERTGGGTCAECNPSEIKTIASGTWPGTDDHLISPGAHHDCRVAKFPPHIKTHISGMLDHENFIVGQVFFVYEPLLNQIGLFSMPKRVLHRTFFLHPRNGDLLDANPAYFTSNPVQARCNNE